MRRRDPLDSGPGAWPVTVDPVGPSGQATPVDGAMSGGVAGHGIPAQPLTAALSGSEATLAPQLVASGAQLSDGQEHLNAIVARCGHRKCTATCAHRPTAERWCPDEWSSLLELEGPARAAAGAFLVHQTPASRPPYARDLDDFASWCRDQGVELLEARRGHVDFWQRELEDKGRRPATIARKLAAVAGYFRLAVLDELVIRNAVDGVRRPKVDGDSPRLGLSRDQARAFLAESAAAGVRDHALACLLVLNGLRVSEAVRPARTAARSSGIG